MTPGTDSDVKTYKPSKRLKSNYRRYTRADSTDLSLKEYAKLCPKENEQWRKNKRS